MTAIDHAIDTEPAKVPLPWFVKVSRTMGGWEAPVWDGLQAAVAASGLEVVPYSALEPSQAGAALTERS